MVHRDYKVSFPEDVTSLSQGEEYFFVEMNGRTERIQLHDYSRLYRVPWLYETVLYELLKCNTPVAICDILEKTLQKSDVDPADLRVLEIGAGSGIFGEHLRNLGIAHITGLDILDVAHEAAERDRPGLYEGYYVTDLTQLPEDVQGEMEAREFNCVAVASATGWGNHIPVQGFQQAFDLLVQGGWFVYHVKRDAEDAECVELCRWIDDLIESGRLDLRAKEKCFHRYSIEGQPIYYDVVIGTKQT